MARRWSPNLLTAMHFTLGLAAMLFALTNQWMLAAGLVFAAAFFDSWDARVARRLNAAGEARELDLLADLMSFGIAPATLAYFMHFMNLGWGGYLLAVIFPVAAAVRLARYTAPEAKGHYFGLPLKVAGPLLAGVTFAGYSLPASFHALVVLLFSALTLSHLKIPKVW